MTCDKQGELAGGVRRPASVAAPGRDDGVAAQASVPDCANFWQAAGNFATILGMTGMPSCNNNDFCAKSGLVCSQIAVLLQLKAQFKLIYEQNFT